MDQVAWDTLTDSAKRAIMFAYKPKVAEPFKASMHDTTSTDDTTGDYKNAPIDANADDDPSGTADELPTPTLEVLAHALRGKTPQNSSSKKKGHPGDIRKVLGSDKKQQPKIQGNIHYHITTTSADVT